MVASYSYDIVLIESHYATRSPITKLNIRGFVPAFIRLGWLGDFEGGFVPAFICSDGQGYDWFISVPFHGDLLQYSGRGTGLEIQARPWPGLIPWLGYPKAVDNKQQVDTAILDFSKAFDKVAHSRLLYKLDYYGIRGNLLNWLKSFLHGYSQQVVVNGVKSPACEVTQGSVPWPHTLLDLYQ